MRPRTTSSAIATGSMAALSRRLRAMGVRDKPTAPASPWQNGFAERLIGLIRLKLIRSIARIQPGIHELSDVIQPRFRRHIGWKASLLLWCVLHLAVAEGPVLWQDIDEINKDVLLAHAGL